jgi:predicted transposase YdaD
LVTRNLPFPRGKDVTDVFEIDDLEEAKEMLSKRVEKWDQELLARGRAQGLDEGEAKGEAKARADIAEVLLKSGHSVEKVAAYTKLSVEEVRNLQAEVAH